MGWGCSSVSGLLDAPGPGFNPQAVGGARGTDTQHTAGVLSLFSFSSLRFSLKTQFYFQLSPYFISLFGRKNAVFGGTAEQDSKGQGERPSRTSRRHSSRWGCRFSPHGPHFRWDPPPQSCSGQAEGRLASLPGLVSTCDHGMQKKRYALTSKAEFLSSCVSPTPHSPKQSHLLCHSKESRWGPQASSERAACLKEN